MINIIEKLKGLISKKEEKRAKMQMLMRYRPKCYQAGAIDRLTASFRGSNYSADVEIQGALKIIRGRSRELAMNNVYMRKFLESLVVNVIGYEGIILQNQAKDSNGKFDELANNTIEEHWQKFCNEGVCDVTGELSMQELLSIVLKSVARDGEVLIRIIRGWDNQYRYTLQLIEADLLDENYNRELTNGNRIVMGVEKDKWGRRVAYHLLTSHPGDYSHQGIKYQVIPARDIIHVYAADRVGQTRGVPWAYAAMILLNNLGAYTESAILNARVGASKMGFYVSPTGDLETVSSGVDDTGEFVEEVEPGIFGRLPKGWDFKEFRPEYPSGEFSDFNKAMLRGIASGLCMAYSTISSDLADVNFSSIRSGKIDERDMYRYLQRWLVSKTVNKIYQSWLDTALMVGALKMPNGSALPYGKYDKFNAARWQTRGFDWVDPKSDIEADIIAVNFGLKTRNEIIASRGRDLRDTFEQLKREQDIAKEYGLDFFTGKTEKAEKVKKENNGGKDEVLEDIKQE